MNHRDNDIFFAEIAVEACTAANELVDFTADFDATEARADDDEMEKPAAALGIAGGFRLFHSTDDLLAEIDSVAHDFKGEGVLGHAGDDAEVAIRTAGDDHVVVVQTSEGAVTIVIFNFRSGQVDS